MPNAIRPSVIRARKVLTACFLLTCLLCWSQPAYAQKPVASQEDAPQKIDLAAYLHPTYDAGVIGLLDRNTLLTTRSPGVGSATLDFWDIHNKKIQTSIPILAPIDAWSATISYDGLYLIGLQGVATYLPEPVYNPHIVYLWNLPKRAFSRQIDLGPHASVYSVCFMPGQPDRAIVTENPTKDATNFPQFATLGCLTGRLIQAVRYQDATVVTLHNHLFSPDGKMMVGLYPAGEGDRYGAFDVFDAHTLKLLYRADGSKGHFVVSDNAFFIGNNKLFLGSSFYDIKTHQTTPFLPSHSTQKVACLVPVPKQSAYGLFVVKSDKAEPDLELWNIVSHKSVRRWPLPRRSRPVPVKKDNEVHQTEPIGIDYAYVSRDGEAFGILDSNGMAYIYDYNFNALP